MTWITRQEKNNRPDTHYYLGLTCICGTTSLDEKQNISYAPKIKQYDCCKRCQNILKRKKTYNKIKLQEAKLKLCQDRLERNLKTDIKLQDMVLRNITHPDTETPVNVSHLQNVLGDDCPKEVFEAVLIPLLISRKITIFEGMISPSFVEVDDVT